MVLLPTRFAGLSRWPARCILLLFTAFTTWSVVVSFSQGYWLFGAQRGTHDLEFYRDVVTQVHEGKGYYEVANDCLIRHGFVSESGIGSMFNWRQPTYAWVLASAPDPDWFYWIFLALALTSVIVTVRTLLAPFCGSAAQILAIIVLMGGAFSWTIYEHDAFLSTEPWCEVLLLFSLCAYARGWWPAGMICCLGALAFRELALPYCLVAVVIAGWRKRWLEVAFWIVCLALYMFLLFLHHQEIARRHSQSAPVSIQLWFTPTGLPFVLRTCVMNVAIRPLPPILHGFFLPLALLGLAAWPGELGPRMFLTALSYVVSYCFVIAAEYWGILYTFLMVLGIFQAPAAMRDLCKAAFTSPPAPV